MIIRSSLGFVCLVGVAFGHSGHSHVVHKQAMAVDAEGDLTSGPRLMRAEDLASSLEIQEQGQAQHTQQAETLEEALPISASDIAYRAWASKFEPVTVSSHARRYAHDAHKAMDLLMGTTGMAEEDLVCDTPLTTLSPAPKHAMENSSPLQLGVDASASDADIRKAYKKKALLLHPDKGGGNDAEEAFKRLSEAHAILSEADSRWRYDLGANAQNANHHGLTGEERRRWNKERAAAHAALNAETRKITNQGNVPGSHKTKSKEKFAQHRQDVKEFLLKKVSPIVHLAWRSRGASGRACDSADGM
ncbi:dnj-1 [Symbiodinium pilosum]|uniref:Dnj-1 protein n=1 Tax=Symbiodinium pilosum TaxID=2952 RepID=A0A812NYI1_SYMPI|nr:dnj-1 [Symbiodinium pilosum]